MMKARPANPSKPRWSALLLTLVLLGSAWLWAGRAGSAAEKAVISADRRGWGDTNKGTIALEGNVTITLGELRITCEQAEIDADGKTGKLTGKVVLTDKGVTIKSDVLDMDLQKRKGVFTGKVSMIRDEEKSTSGGKQEVTKERVELTCDKLEGNTSKRTFVATGNVKLLHTDFNADCQAASFDEKTEKLILSGDARLVRKENEELKAGRVEVDLKAKKFTATESVELTFEVEDDNAEETAEEGAGDDSKSAEEDPEGSKEDSGEGGKQEQPATGSGTDSGSGTGTP